MVLEFSHFEEQLFHSAYSHLVQGHVLLPEKYLDAQIYSVDLLMEVKEFNDVSYCACTVVMQFSDSVWAYKMNQTWKDVIEEKY